MRKGFPTFRFAGPPLTPYRQVLGQRLAFPGSITLVIAA